MINKIIRGRDSLSALFTGQVGGRQGFTLIEMLVVIGIVGVLASLVLIGLNPARQASRDSRRISNVHQLQNTLEVYYLRNGSYPSGDVTTIDGFAEAVGSDASERARYGYTRVSGFEYLLGVSLEGSTESPVRNGMAGGVDCAQPASYCVSVE